MDSGSADEVLLAKDYIKFIQGKDNLLHESDSLDDGIQKIKHKISDLANIKNVNFLLGAGASSDAIPNMFTMLEKIESLLNNLEDSISKISSDKNEALWNASFLSDEIILDDQHLLFEDNEIYSSKTDYDTLEIEESYFQNTNFILAKHILDIKELYIKIKLNAGENLEEILGILYSHRSYLKGIKEENLINSLLISLIENSIYNEINIDLDFPNKNTVHALSLYKRLYHKLSLRNKDLSRVNVFTTNNDLLSEKALDYLNINYNNGFGGGLSKVFNPARFTYTFSRKIDSNLEKYEPLENLVYLYKLHGSISWIESNDNSFFNIKEVEVTKKTKPKENVLIYPTPLKQNKSLGSPYADLIREYQKKLLLPHNVLFVIGYSFSDEHINNIIYQALASNPSISIVIFGEHPKAAISKVEDRRIYRIWGEIPRSTQSEKIHYFEYIVNNLIPDLDTHRDDELLENFIRKIKHSNIQIGESK